MTDVYLYLYLHTPPTTLNKSVLSEFRPILPFFFQTKQGNMGKQKRRWKNKKIASTRAPKVRKVEALKGRRGLFLVD